MQALQVQVQAVVVEALAATWCHWASEASNHSPTSFVYLYSLSHLPILPHALTPHAQVANMRNCPSTVFR